MLFFRKSSIIYISEVDRQHKLRNRYTSAICPSELLSVLSGAFFFRTDKMKKAKYNPSTDPELDNSNFNRDELLGDFAALTDEQYLLCRDSGFTQ
jgi:hypothetical protein